MEQVVFGGSPDTLNSGATEYAFPNGGEAGWYGTETYRAQGVSAAGVMKNLYVELSAAPGAGAGDAYTFTLMVNGVASALTCTITQPATSGNDTTHEVALAAGDRISLRATPVSTPSATPSAQWSMMFEGTTSKESNFFTGLGIEKTYANSYGRAFAGHIGDFVNSSAVGQQVIPTSGTIKNMYVGLSADPGTAPDAYRITLMKNGVDTTLTVTITADDTTGNDTTHTVAVVAGDTVSLHGEALNTPNNSPQCWVGMTFLADVDGESLVLGASADALDTSTTEYQLITGSFNNVGTNVQVWATPETVRQSLGQVCVLRKLYMKMSGSPYKNSETEDKYTFTLRQNAGDTTLVVAIVGNNTTGSDTDHSVTIAAGDNLSLQSVPSSTPTARGVAWGMVCYIAPSGGWGNITKIHGVTATDITKVHGIAVADIAKINGVAV